MIGILVVSHGYLAKEFINIMEHIVGVQEQVSYVCIDPDDDIDKISIEIKEKISNLNSGEGVIILTDMFGGTPANLTLPFLKEGKVEMISGLNLPMLIKIISKRGSSTITNLVQETEEAGRHYIQSALKIINHKI